MKRFPVFLLTCCLLMGSLSARLWTSADGTKAFEADFLRFDNGAVYVRLETGKEIHFLLSVLSQADQDFVLQLQSLIDAGGRPKVDVQQPPPPPAVVAPPPATAGSEGSSGVLPKKERPTVQQSVFRAIGPFLTRFDGRAFQPTSLRGIPRYYLIYYGASWCPGCNSTLGDFKNVYNKVIRPDPAFEVVHVSADLNVLEAEQWARANGLIWPTIQNVDREASGLLPYASGLTPSYTLIDGRGQILATGGGACVQKIRELQQGGS